MKKGSQTDITSLLRLDVTNATQVTWGRGDENGAPNWYHSLAEVRVDERDKGHQSPKVEHQKKEASVRSLKQEKMTSLTPRLQGKKLGWHQNYNTRSETWEQLKSKGSRTKARWCLDRESMGGTTGKRKVGEHFVTDQYDIAGRGRIKPILEQSGAATSPDSGAWRQKQNQCRIQMQREEHRA